jgi:transposase
MNTPFPLKFHTQDSVSYRQAPSGPAKVIPINETVLSDISRKNSELICKNEFLVGRVEQLTKQLEKARFDNRNKIDRMKMQLREVKQSLKSQLHEEKAKLKKAKNALKAEIDQLKAKIRFLNRELYGKKTEKGTASKKADNKRRGKGSRSRGKRGKRKGTKNHPRRDHSHLEQREESYDVDEQEKMCAHCGKEKSLLPTTEESEIVEIEVKGYRRKVKKKRYAKRCECDEEPGIVTASGPPKALTKSSYGNSIWAEVLLQKYAFQIPIHRLLAIWGANGLDIPE